MAVKKENKVKINFNKITIGLASPEEVLERSSGEVFKPETISYRTYKPELDITYDRNGNIKTLKRYKTTLKDDLIYTYSGNKLINLTGTTTASYTYDANGNMIFDGRKYMFIEYNLLNLPYQIMRNDTMATYKYLADGTKLSATQDSIIPSSQLGGRPTIVQNGFDYLGSLVYKRESNIVTGMESTSFGGGRINATNSSYDINYFITDHLGSTRVIVDNNGGIKEMIHYYPFGKTWENPNHPAPQTRYLFNGKEKQSMTGLNLLDYGNRMYDPEIARWLVQDMLQEKGYAWSSYVFCFDNPLRFIDQDGRWGEDIHYGDKKEKRGTLFWMQEGGRFTPAEAEIIAKANHSIDFVVLGRSSIPIIGNQSYHFNSNGENEIDSRQEKAEQHLEKAIDLKNKASDLREEANALREEGGSSNERKANSYEKRALKKEKSALKNLGYGLHPVQDPEAHNDEVVKGKRGFKSHIGTTPKGEPKPDEANRRPDEVKEAKRRSLEYVDRYLDATRR